MKFRGCIWESNLLPLTRLLIDFLFPEVFDFFHVQDDSSVLELETRDLVSLD